MRILFLSQLLPLPLDAGPKFRSYYVLRYLAEAGHDVTLLSFRRPSDSEADIQALKAFCRSVETVPMVRSRFKDALSGARSLIANDSFLMVRDRVPEMFERMRALDARKSFDAVHADQLWMAPYALRAVSSGKRVLDQHNAVYKAVERMTDGSSNPLFRVLLGSESSKLQRFEQRTIGEFDDVTWVTEEDRQSFEPRPAERQTRERVIPIATDPSTHALARRDRPFRVTFLGGMHWPPNAEGVSWFAKSCWPAIAERSSAAVFTVVGKGAPADVRTAPHAERIDVKGYVENLDTVLDETAVFVVPLLSGAGMRVKILDAWSSGLPVVSTAVGAEGMEYRNGDNLLIADEAQEFAEAVLRVLGDSELAKRIGEAGRSTVEQSYDWRKVYQAWDEIYN